MIYKFKSKATGDLIMLGPQGDELLGLIGRTPAAQGIIEPAAMGAAIQALEAAIAAERAAAAMPPDDADTAVPRRAISLRQRAWPFIDMLKRALAANQAVVWGA